MLSVLFASIASFVSEVSSSIVKFEVSHHKESVYTAGFINVIFATAVFTVLAVFRENFVFSLASLPTFTLRAFLEILQAHVSMKALVKSDRSTFVFVRNLTIPLLLIVDLVLGFTIDFNQWLGIGLITIVFGVIIYFHVLSFKGIGYPLFTAVNAVATISLFKYNITYFNSVEADQIVIGLILMVYFFFTAKFLSGENPLRFLKHKLFLGQGAFHGLASIFAAFAVSFGSPSIALTAERTSGVLAGIISGRNYFQEKKFGAKILVGAALVFGLVLLAL